MRTLSSPSTLARIPASIRVSVGRQNGLTTLLLCEKRKKACALKAMTFFMQVQTNTRILVHSASKHALTGLGTRQPRRDILFKQLREAACRTGQTYNGKGTKEAV